MTQLTGKSSVKVDGTEMLTDVDSTLNVGGVSREPVTGPKGVQGYRETPEAPTLTTTVRHTEDTDLIALSRIKNATVITQTDTGDAYLLRRAFVTDTVEISGGNIRLNWSGMGLERL
ncbi:phage tail tube protein [Halomonas salina]|uniref:Phage tail tube protein n=1 Tax=Halomonas salina TaxID=42565 RepID=A0ABR4WSQ4_9GAMM|nr:phage tail tube protein [Halomonas salina]KGE77648.1 hypothetical protein FP66_08440 [Halomonas salina]